MYISNVLSGSINPSTRKSSRKSKIVPTSESDKMQGKDEPITVTNLTCHYLSDTADATICNIVIPLPGTSSPTAEVAILPASYPPYVNLFTLSHFKP